MKCYILLDTYTYFYVESAYLEVVLKRMLMFYPCLNCKSHMKCNSVRPQRPHKKRRWRPILGPLGPIQGVGGLFWGVLDLSRGLKDYFGASHAYPEGWGLSGAFWAYSWGLEAYFGACGAYSGH